MSTKRIDVFASAKIKLVTFVQTMNDRPGALNWGIFKVARLGEQSDSVPLP